MNARASNSDRTSTEDGDPQALAELRSLKIPDGEMIVWHLYIQDFAEEPLVRVNFLALQTMMTPEECQASLDLLVAAGFVQKIDNEYANSAKGAKAAMARGVRLC